jgi:hypothetical protein
MSPKLSVNRLNWQLLYHDVPASQHRSHLLWWFRLTHQSLRNPCLKLPLNDSS